MKRRKKILLCLIVTGLLLIGIGIIFGINAYVINTGNRYIISNEEAKGIGADCILVLGAKVRDSEPSIMLQDRLKTGIGLYNDGAAPVLLMSGDHGTKEYDEVNVMKNYAMEAGVPSEDVFMDHAGFSTYDSIYRVKEIFGANKIIIVSQEYHLYRALYIAEKLGLEAYGVSADLREYIGQQSRDIREVLARDKDFVKCIFTPESEYLGGKISLSGSGDVTDDR